MRRKLVRSLPLLAAVAMLQATAGALKAQGTIAEGAIVYEREVFRYTAAGRPDPFKSLLREADLGVRIEDLTLRGIVHHADPAQSVAVLTQKGSDRRIQAQVGERVGTLRVLAIYPDRVEVVVEELGVARRETLRMERTPSGEGNR